MRNQYLKPVLLLLAILTTFSLLSGIELQKNPYRAMLYSAVLPGGGQIYNHAYVKSAVVVGLQTYLVSTALRHNDRIEHYQKLMDNSVSGGQDYLIYELKRNDFKDKLRSDYWWMGTVLLLSVADAFVDAHLYNYNTEKERIKLKFEDKMLQISYRF